MTKTERALCRQCEGNGVVRIPGGISVCPRCNGDCWESGDLPTDATAELLAALDELYPLPDDTRRVERAGRTAYALKRWMGRAHAELEALVAGVIERAAKEAQDSK